jgi:hypothetical protein
MVNVVFILLVLAIVVSAAVNSVRRSRKRDELNRLMKTILEEDKRDGTEV